MAVAKRCDCSKRTYAQTLRETKEECTLSLQNLHRYQSQLQLCPNVLQVTEQPPAAIQDAAPEKMRNPMYGNLQSMVDPDEFGPEFITQLSFSEKSDNTASDGDVTKAAYAHAVHDLSAITMQEPVPMAPPEEIEIFGVGEPSAQDIQNMVDDNFFTDIAEPAIPPLASAAAQNITTPASALLSEAPAPSRPSKASQKQKNQDTDSLLAVELPKEQSADGREVSGFPLSPVHGIAGPDIPPPLLLGEPSPQPRTRPEADLAPVGGMLEL